MSSYDKYESRIRKAALLGDIENGLRAGAKCLICQCWKKPCANCSAITRSGNAADRPPRAAPARDKSFLYRQAAARLG